MVVATQTDDAVDEAKPKTVTHAATAECGDQDANSPRRQVPRVGWWARKGAFCLIIMLPFLLTVGAAGLKYLDWTQKAAQTAEAESTRAATETAVAMLSYRPDTVQNDLDKAKDRMTGAFRDSYSSLVDDVVAPAAIQKLITAVATVPAAAPVSTTQNHAVVLLFVNQKLAFGSEAPSSTNSTVRVTLDKSGGKWLVSGFDPI